MRLPQLPVRGLGLVLPLLLLCIASLAAPAETRPASRASSPTGPRSFAQLPVAQIHVDLARDEGPLELWRQSIGNGGINSRPLTPAVVDGLAKLHPRLIRIFLQEYFAIYPEHGRFDWSQLDPYMDALEKTGAKVVAAITIKPKPLFPNVDPSIWKPNDVSEWQAMIAALVKRYSVDRKIVTYWEIGNETDIGENGGCPYLIADPAQYAEFYDMTIQPILATFPQAKVGGPAVANAGSDYLPKFIEHCLQEHTRLDFISWHVYSGDPDRHAAMVKKYRKLLEPFGDKRPEMLVTEWNKGFEPVSLEEAAFAPRRAAAAAACLIAYADAGVDWTFYYHANDQVCYLDEFKPFFRNPGIMYHHWNEVPHRFGLFGVDQKVRPQYFVYQMLGRMGDQRVHADCDAEDVRVLAGRKDDAASLLIANYGMRESRDCILNLHFSNLKPAGKRLTVYRIDGKEGWSQQTLELTPRESREVDVTEEFSCQIYSPADGVCLVLLGPRA